MKAALLIMMGAAAWAQPALDAAAKAQVIESAVEKLNGHYVFPEVAKKMEESLRAKWKSGAYEAITDGPAFARQLTEDLQAISKDRHLRVRYSPQPLPAGPPQPTEEERDQFRAQMLKDNCGFRKVERLDGNIGYLKFNFFGDPEVCGATASAAMNFLGGVDALIVDLRENGGGDPAMVAYLTSYLFDQKTHLNDIWERKSETTRSYYTKPDVPGRKLAGKPVYVLTAKRTFSGAEEYAYNLKNLKRATLIGETTGGGAHPTRGLKIHDHFMIGVPFARSINPVSKTNWEGTGVEPDVKVAAADAMEEALKLIREKAR